MDQNEYISSQPEQEAPQIVPPVPEQPRCNIGPPHNPAPNQQVPPQNYAYRGNGTGRRESPYANSP